MFIYWARADVLSRSRSGCNRRLSTIFRGQRLRDNATEIRPHFEDGETYFKPPELIFLGRRLAVVLRFFSLVAC